MADGQCGRETKHLAPDDETDAVERTAEHALEDRPYQEKLGSPVRRGRIMQELAIVCCLIPNTVTRERSIALLPTLIQTWERFRALLVNAAGHGPVRLPC